MKIAITRGISERFNACELTHLARQPIDIPLARTQHRQYEAALRSLGVRVVSLPAAADLPDSVFVEDAAVVLPECAIVMRPGADSRKPETEAVAEALRPFRSLHSVCAPGCIDGGDVLVVGKTLFVGQGTRSNAAAIEQVRAVVSEFGYRVLAVPVRQCLHLKSAATQVAEDTLLISPAWIDKAQFGNVRCIDVDPAEPGAANAVLVGDSVIYPAHYPRTRERLEAAGIRLCIVAATEVAKAEGAVSCCSIVFDGAD